MSLDPLHPPIISEENEWKESEDFLNILRDSVQTTGTNAQNTQLQFTPIRKSLELDQIATRWTTEWIEAAKKEAE
jgi:hypothetical protein